MMLTLVKPAFDDLWFRKNLMADEETMSYNARWGGTIPFPEEEWESWYESWVRNPGASRYYRIKWLIFQSCSIFKRQNGEEKNESKRHRFTTHREHAMPK